MHSPPPHEVQRGRSKAKGLFQDHRLEGKRSFPRPPAQSLQLKHPPYEEMGTLGRVSHTGTHDGNGKQDNRTLLDAIVDCRDLSKPFTKKESLKCTDGHVAWMCNSHGGNVINQTPCPVVHPLHACLVLSKCLTGSASTSWRFCLLHMAQGRRTRTSWPES